MLFQKWIDKRIEAYQSDLMRKYCDEVEGMYTKMRGWRHDYHNHIQALQASMALGKYEEVNEYLRQLNDDLTQVDTAIKTGRVMVDAILNGKINIASQNAIPVNAKAVLPAGVTVSDIDLCVIIGNLLDNAVEENRKLPPEDRRANPADFSAMGTVSLIKIIHFQNGSTNQDFRNILTVNRRVKHGGITQFHTFVAFPHTASAASISHGHLGAICQEQRYFKVC